MRGESDRWSPLYRPAASKSSTSIGCGSREASAFESGSNKIREIRIANVSVVELTKHGPALAWKMEGATWKSPELESRAPGNAGSPCEIEKNLGRPVTWRRAVSRAIQPATPLVDPPCA